MVVPSRKRQIAFHVANGDYFGTLAAVLKLIMDDMERDRKNKELAATLRNCITDLMLLQNQYRIVPSMRRGGQEN